MHDLHFLCRFFLKNGFLPKGLFDGLFSCLED